MHDVVGLVADTQERVESVVVLVADLLVVALVDADVLHDLVVELVLQRHTVNRESCLSLTTNS